ncbi:MAG: tRNA (adenosine(37)-N6)-dimethylallyltransferase MiaA [Thiomicrospira sp.]|nr:MAG: tRNA (adenosine(37)-N6)-dimethylallyltransferase MiaA [Thiomicrospira sp.]
MQSVNVAELIKEKTCLAVMGPTASGKSGLTMALAKHLPIEIISVDSALIYRGMDIGTAKPTRDEQVAVPHHLIDILEPTESYSAADFVEDTHELVKEIFARGNLPVLAGGTMMYFNALQQGMAKLPSADEAIRAKIHQAWQKDPAALHERLKQVDPEAAERIHQNDPQRLIRALEVYEMTGKPLTQLQKEGQQAGLTEFKLAKVALIPEDRKKLHQQIAVRFDEMLNNGFLKEAEKVFSLEGLSADLPAIRSVGYRQAWLFFAQEYDYDTFVEKSIVATRQLAKRQITWLRKEQDLLVLDPFKTNVDDRVEAVLDYLSGLAKNA